MNKNLQAGLGVLLFLIGLLWALKGLGAVGGSAMSGSTVWAVIGPIVAIAGGWLVVKAVRTPR